MLITLLIIRSEKCFHFSPDLFSLGLEYMIPFFSLTQASYKQIPRKYIPEKMQYYLHLKIEFRASMLNIIKYFHQNPMSLFWSC